MAIEGGPVSWAAIHNLHHGHSDKEGDPHSPVEGLVHAHMGWMIRGAPVEPERYCPWLLRDRQAMFFERTAGLWAVLGLVVPGLLAGWSGLLWGGLVRVFLMHHLTWSVNSLGHTFGAQPFATGDRSRNSWILGFVALGDGWHNNHHAFPRSAFHGLRPGEVDATGWLIRRLERLGLVWDVQRVRPEQLERQRRAGGGREAIERGSVSALPASTSVAAEAAEPKRAAKRDG
jgi:stearoyl-CoA desaturase (delta-9 desaturase)